MAEAAGAAEAPVPPASTRAASRWVGSAGVQRVSRVCQGTAPFWKGEVSQGSHLETAAPTCCFPVAGLLLGWQCLHQKPCQQSCSLSWSLAEEAERDFAWKCVIFAFCFRPNLYFCLLWFCWAFAEIDCGDSCGSLWGRSKAEPVKAP